MLMLIDLLFILPFRTLSSAFPQLCGVLMHRVIFPMAHRLEYCKARLLGQLACGRAAGCPVPAEWIWLPSATRDPKTVLLFLPGGAFVSSDQTCFQFAAEVLPRLARSLPEGHPLPAILVARYTIPAAEGTATAEVDSVLRWLADDGRRIVACGTSAGGHLAFGAALRASEGQRAHLTGTQPAPTPRPPPALLGAVLISPWLDLTLTSPAMARNATSCVLSLPFLRAGVRQFIGNPTALGNASGGLNHRLSPPAACDTQACGDLSLACGGGRAAKEGSAGALPDAFQAAARTASPAFSDLSSLGPSAVFIAYGAQDLLVDDAR